MRLARVLLVSDHGTINGGQARVAIESARLLADHGLDVTFFVACGPVDPRLDHPRITVECLGLDDILNDPNRLRAMARGIWNPGARAALRRRAASMDPASTILHCHSNVSALSPAIGPELAAGPLASIYTMHEYNLFCPNGAFFDFQEQRICHRRPMGLDCLTTQCDMRHPAHKLWRVARMAVARGPGRMPGGLRDLICLSEVQRRAIAPHVSGDIRLHDLPNPVILPDLPPVAASRNDIFLFTGRLSPEKGTVMFAKAARRAGVRAVFIGEGPEAAAIRAANPEAELTGWLRPGAVEDWIGRARALVFPSLWYETFGLSACEALGRGVPVICGSWNAAAGYVEDGVNGLLYAEASEESLAQTLHRAGDLPDFDPGPIRAALDSRRHLDRLLAIYEKLLRERAAA